MLHSAVIDPMTDGEFKLIGKAEPLEPDLATSAGDADEWWAAQPANAYQLFAIAVEEVVSITWDVGRGSTTVTRWTPDGGVRETSQHHP